MNTLKELLGHKSLDLTLRYAHLFPNYKRRAVDILERQIDSIWTTDLKVNNIPKEVEAVTISN